ncbi:hypothetical protein FRB90_009816, partial [Tulasnella sp. 427]
HCRRYLPTSRSLEDVRRILNNTHHGKSIWSSPHNYLVCEVLHPTQVSCNKNFLKAFKEEAHRFAPWVAGATAVNMLFTGRCRLGKRSFIAVVFDFVNSAFRGTTYLSGSITTIWGISCVLQRVLPAGRFSKARWVINSSLASMWILLLSRSRQVAISLFQFRLAAYSVWKVWKSRGGWSIKHGDLWLIAACWVALIHYKDRTAGKRITGMVGQFMRMVDGSEFEEWQNEKRKHEKGKGKEDNNNNYPPSGSGVRPPRPASPKPYYPPKSRSTAQGGYGTSSSPGPSFTTSNYGPPKPLYPGPSSDSGSYFPPQPPPSSSQPFHPTQSPPMQPYQPPHPNSVPAPGQPSNFELYSKPYGGAGTPAEPDKIVPMANLGVSAATARFEATTSTPSPASRELAAPLETSRGGSPASFVADVPRGPQAFFPTPPSGGTTAATDGDPFSDSRRVSTSAVVAHQEDPHELSEVGSGSAADISGSTASDGGAVL